MKKIIIACLVLFVVFTGYIGFVNAGLDFTAIH